MVQGSFDEGNAVFRKATEIQCYCMGSFATSYSTVKVINRRDKSYLETVLVTGDDFNKNVSR